MHTVHARTHAHAHRHGHLHLAQRLRQKSPCNNCCNSLRGPPKGSVFIYKGTPSANNGSEARAHPRVHGLRMWVDVCVCVCSRIHTCIHNQVYLIIIDSPWASIESHIHTHTHPYSTYTYLPIALPQVWLPWNILFPGPEVRPDIGRKNTFQHPFVLFFPAFMYVPCMYDLCM